MLLASVRLKRLPEERAVVNELSSRVLVQHRVRTAVDQTQKGPHIVLVRVELVAVVVVVVVTDVAHLLLLLLMLLLLLLLLLDHFSLDAAVSVAAVADDVLLVHGRLRVRGQAVTLCRRRTLKHLT